MGWVFVVRTFASLGLGILMLALCACNKEMNFTGLKQGASIQSGGKTGEPEGGDKVTGPLTDEVIVDGQCLANNCNPDEQKPKTEILKFSVDSIRSQRPLDIVWVIDNSTSMKEEIAHIRRNLKSFIEHVRQFANLRTIILSKANASNYNRDYVINVPDIMGASLSQDVLSIDHLIGSHDALYWASQLVCTDPKKCGDQIKYPFCSDFQKCKQHYQNLVGLNKSQIFRDAAKKVFVFVTDDEATDVQDQRFLEIYKEATATAPVKVFSFVALSKSESPCAAGVGHVYKDLSRATSGRAFNICDSDWQMHFRDIAEDLEQSVIRTFDIRGNVQILNVKVNGVKLEANQYQFVRNVLVITAGVLRDKDEVEVEIKNQVPVASR